MADIRSYLQKILDAIYGEEVRGSIHDALAAMNVESSSAMEQAATAKDSARASAESAQASAAIATQKESEAVVSAEAAKTSEINAKASETIISEKTAEAVEAAAGAKASEIKAVNSEAVATQKAAEAAESQSAAAQSAAVAEAAEDRANAVKSEIETLGAQATADKNAAEAAKTAAETARDDAEASQVAAEAAESSAQAAKTAAEAARDDAENSKSASQSAKTAAEAAQAAAEAAENAASLSRDAAATSAISAQQYSGKPPKPQDGSWWIWDATQQKYIDSGIGCELVGPTGNGVEDITLTQGDHAPGTTDIYTVTMTDGTTYSISVYNGRNGTGVGDVQGISFDLVIPASGWLNGEITIADSRLLAMPTHKYFLSADEASREKFLECNVQPKDITTAGFITFKNDADPAIDLTVNLIRFELTANGS